MCGASPHKEISLKTRVIALVLFLAASGRASADTLFGTSVLFHNSGVITTTVCWIYNGGSKPVRIVSVGLPSFNPDQPSQGAASDNCVGTLAPDRSCSFSGSLGTFGGGIAMVKGSTKKLRGDCTLYDTATFTSRITVPMR